MLSTCTILDGKRFSALKALSVINSSVIYVLFPITLILYLFFIFRFDVSQIPGISVIVKNFGSYYGVWNQGNKYFPRLAGLTAEPQQFASIISFSLIYSIINYSYTKNKKHLIYLILIIAVGLFSQSKLFIAIVIFGFFLKPSKVTILVGIIFIGLFALVFINLPTYTNIFGDKFNSFAFIERAYNYQNIFDIFQNKPFFGIGIGQYGSYLEYYQKVIPFINLVPAAADYKPNFDLGQIIAESGIFGLVLFLCFEMYIFLQINMRIKRAKKTNDFSKIIPLEIIRANLILLIAISFFSYELFHAQFWIFNGIAIFLCSRKGTNLLNKEQLFHSREAV